MCTHFDHKSPWIILTPKYWFINEIWCVETNRILRWLHVKKHPTHSEKNTNTGNWYCSSIYLNSYNHRINILVVNYFFGTLFIKCRSLTTSIKCLMYGGDKMDIVVRSGYQVVFINYSDVQKCLSFDASFIIVMIIQNIRAWKSVFIKMHKPFIQKWLIWSAKVTCISSIHKRHLKSVIKISRLQ